MASSRNDQVCGTPERVVETQFVEMEPISPSLSPVGPVTPGSPPNRPPWIKTLEMPISPPHKRIRPTVDPDHKYNTEWTTPQKAKVAGAVEFLDAHNLLNQPGTSKIDIFRHFDIPPRSGYRILAGESLRRVDTLFENPRHPPRKVSWDDIEKMEKLLRQEGFEARQMTWEQLGSSIGLEVDGRTIQRAMSTIKYSKCVACQKAYVEARTAEKRVEYARIMLEKYPSWKDWMWIRFSDEVHFGWGPQGKLMIIRKEGERLCQDCIQETETPTEP